MKKENSNFSPFLSGIGKILEKNRGYDSGPEKIALKKFGKIWHTPAGCTGKMIRPGIDRSTF